MSYYKCKGISRKGNKIEVNVASSNCFPITYSKSEYTQRENQETLFWLEDNISLGRLEINAINEKRQQVFTIGELIHNLDKLRIRESEEK